VGGVVGRPRITAEPIDGGYRTADGTFYTAREWIAIERRRAGWRRSAAIRRMDPELRRRHLEATQRYQKTEKAKEARRRRLRELARRRHEDFEHECEVKYGAMTDAEIQLRILGHEVELRQLRHVLKGRAMNTRVRSAA
jgi:hypothetical protein